MNVFVLDENPIVAATYACDKHLVKMPLETAQLLSTVAQKRGYQALYRITHRNNPITNWVGNSVHNWTWLCEHGLELSRQYTRVFGKIHKCQNVIQNLADRTLEIWSELGDSKRHTDFFLCMPDDCKDTENPIESYRNCYRIHKSYMAKWKNRQPPSWW